MILIDTSVISELVKPEPYRGDRQGLWHRADRNARFERPHQLRRDAHRSMADRLTVRHIARYPPST